MAQDNIELIVDEPIDGHFYWILLKQEHPGSPPHTVESAPGPLQSHSAAMIAGIAALQRRRDERGAGHGPLPYVAAGSRLCDGARRI